MNIAASTLNLSSEVEQHRSAREALAQHPYLRHEAGEDDDQPADGLLLKLLIDRELLIDEVAEDTLGAMAKQDLQTGREELMGQIMGRKMAIGIQPETPLTAREASTIFGDLPNR